ncbi:hypothetical protein RB195_018422 [Necator americanus]|uniref:Uncharacterized protein n=1 Tax=Necator americanus TaxID=51031 RepID=A0ABR1C9S6_NECAM
MCSPIHTVSTGRDTIKSTRSLHASDLDKMNAGRPRRDGPRGYCQAVRLLTAVQPKKHQRSDRILISFENSRRFRKDTDMLF